MTLEMEMAFGTLGTGKADIHTDTLRGGREGKGKGPKGEWDSPP